MVHIDPLVAAAHLYNATIQRVIAHEKATVRYMSTDDIGNSNGALEEELLRIERENITHYHERLPAAVAVYQTGRSNYVHVKILFSGNALHSSGAALNLASNMLLKMHTGSDEYGIELKNEPLMKWESIEERDRDGRLAMYLTQFFVLSLPVAETNWLSHRMI